MTHPLNLDRLARRLGHAFRQPQLLRQALTHRSYSATNNERFEFIGDSILNYTVARMLYDQFGQLSEGELSRLRANLVNQATLADIARELNIGDCLFLGEGELKSGGHDRASILADALEALFAAVSFDVDFAQAEQVVRGLYASRIAAIDPNKHAKDAKTRLQEALQAKRYSLPRYTILAQLGEAHEQSFRVACDLAEIGIMTEGQGGSRRAAEQQAAELALSALEARQPARRKP